MKALNKTDHEALQRVERLLREVLSEKAIFLSIDNAPQPNRWEVAADMVARLDSEYTL